MSGEGRGARSEGAREGPARLSRSRAAALAAACFLLAWSAASRLSTGRDPADPAAPAAEHALQTSVARAPGPAAAPRAAVTGSDSGPEGARSTSGAAIERAHDDPGPSSSTPEVTPVERDPLAAPDVPGPPGPDGDPHSVHIVGSVVDIEGAPVADATVEAGMRLGTPDPRAERAAFTGPDGRFRLGPLAPRDRLEVAARTGARRSAVQVIAAAKAGTYDAYSLRLTDGAVVRGRVIGIDGAPAAGIVVRRDAASAGARTPALALEAVVGMPMQAGQVATGEDGRFVLTRVEAGPFTIEAADPTTGDSASARIDVRADAVHEDVELRLAPSPLAGRMRGLVTAPGGAPLGGARVALKRQVFDWADPDHAKVLADAGDPAPGKPVRIRRSPEREEIFELPSEIAFRTGAERIVTCDARGRFDLRCAAGAYELSAEAGPAPGGPFCFRGGGVKARVEGGGSVDLVIEVRPLGAIEGTVEGGAERVRTFARLRQVPGGPDPGEADRAAVDGAGRFAFSSVAPGVYELRIQEAQGDDLAFAVVPVEVREGERAAVHVARAPTVETRLRVTGLARSWLERARLTASNGSQSVDLEPLREAPGDTFVLRAPAGDYTLGLWSAGPRSLSATRSVRVPSDGELVLAIPPGRGALRARFPSAGGLGGPMELHSETVQLSIHPSSEESEERVEDIPAGRYTLRIRGMEEREVVIPDGGEVVIDVPARSPRRSYEPGDGE